MPSDADDPSTDPAPVGGRRPARQRQTRRLRRRAADDRERQILLAVALAGAVTFRYSALIVQQSLAWFAVATLLAVLYLLWRFVPAHERVADALEARDR